jgi:hypothetical protein
VQLEALIRDILQIGRSLLRPSRLAHSQAPEPSSQDRHGSQSAKAQVSNRRTVDPKKAKEAVEYLQRAYEIAEKVDERPMQGGGGEQGVIGSSFRETMKETKVVFYSVMCGVTDVVRRL